MTPKHSPIELLAAAPAEFLAIARRFGVSPDPSLATAGQTRPSSDYVSAYGPPPPLQLAAGVRLSCTGVGKVNAAISATKLLDAWKKSSSPATAVAAPLLISVGIAGALPFLPTVGAATNSSPGFACQLLDVILASRSCYGDEGVQTPDAFIDCWQMGFPPGPFAASGVLCDQSVLRTLPLLKTTTGTAIAAWAARLGPIATVSTCSGTDVAAAAIAARTGAIAEVMEGAAVAHAVVAACDASFAPRFAELRIISNTTGNRQSQVWQLGPALQRLAEAAELLVKNLQSPAAGQTQQPASP